MFVQCPMTCKKEKGRVTLFVDRTFLLYLPTICHKLPVCPVSMQPLNGKLSPRKLRRGTYKHLLPRTVPRRNSSPFPVSRATHEPSESNATSVATCSPSHPLVILCSDCPLQSLVMCDFHVFLLSEVSGVLF